MIDEHRHAALSTKSCRSHSRRTRASTAGFPGRIIRYASGVDRSTIVELKRHDPVPITSTPPVTPSVPSTTPRTTASICGQSGSKSRGKCESSSPLLLADVRASTPGLVSVVRPRQSADTVEFAGRTRIATVSVSLIVPFANAAPAAEPARRRHTVTGPGRSDRKSDCGSASHSAKSATADTAPTQMASGFEKGLPLTE